MKKTVLYLCAGILALGLTACGGENPDAGASDESSSATGTVSDSASDSDVPEESDAQGTEQTESGEGSEATEPENVGWSEEMTGLRAAVVDAVGQDEYWPDMPMDGEMLNMFYGVSAELYDDFMAETPMISTNVDALVIIKAKEGQVDAVYDLMKAYRENLVNDTMQYPMNLSKIQGSMLEKVGNYVVFVQLGGNAGIPSEETDETQALANSQEANTKAMEAVKAKLGQ